jgi:adenine-specific DNA-methyltransferase
MRSWKWSIETLKSKKETEMSVRYDRNKQPAVYVKSRINEDGMLPLSIWEKTEYSATAYGTNLLLNIMNN